MKKSILLPLAVAFAAVVAAPAFAETKAVKDDPITHECKEAAKKDHVTADKMKDYMKTCVEKHNQSKGTGMPGMAPK